MSFQRSQKWYAQKMGCAGCRRRPSGVHSPVSKTNNAPCKPRNPANPAAGIILI
jgi:hypothetical protein